MKNETKMWLDYSRENYESANILLKSGLFNPCLQNVQQRKEVPYGLKIAPTCLFL